MLAEVLEALAIKPNGIYFDGTLGRAGHSKEILKHLNTQGRLIACDKDPEAIALTRKMLGDDPRIEFIHGSFVKLEEIAKERELIGKIDGILLDLGVSSPQLEDPKRGFSFLYEGPLDMRMDNTAGITAENWLAMAKESEIAQVLKEFGEERFARRIANAIVKTRGLEPITTTSQLAEIVKKANPAWEKGKNPATRTFQAIRIFLNRELQELNQVLEQALNVLSIGGRLVVISFHSLEDRIVKNFMRRWSKGEQLPKELPIISKERPRLQSLGHGTKPTATEIAQNPRARSAVLRVAEKLL